MTTKIGPEKNEKCLKKHKRPLAAPVRIMDEFRALKDLAVDSETFREFRFTCEDILKWSGLILPQTEPYKENAWRIQIELMRDYPQSPPQVRLLTPIYHPNISAESGEIALQMIEKRNWVSSVRITEVIDAILGLIDNPNAEYESLVLNENAAKEFKDNNDDFKKNAVQKAKKQALKRPLEPECRRKSRRSKPRENQSE